MAHSSSVLRPNRGTPSSGRSRVAEVARLGAKALFAAADLFLGEWPGPRLLIYHQVGSGSGRQMDVSPVVFRRHLDWLGERGRIVSLEEALVDAGGETANRTFALTFDDGYADLFRNAFPLLRERGLPFALYLVTDPIEMGVADRAEPLTWDQVGAMLESGLVTLGAHTHRHRDLRRLGREEIEEELERSDELIEARTGRRPRHFAYPKGYWAAAADPLVRQRYDTAVLGAGPPVTADNDRYRLHRMPVQRSDGTLFFTRKVLRGMRMEEWVRSRLRGYRHPRSDGPKEDLGSGR